MGRTAPRDIHATDEIATRWLGKTYGQLSPREQKVARHVVARLPISALVARDREPAPSRGQRAADAVATFGGSWTFVGLFVAVMLLWVGLNGLLRFALGSTFDPFPYILLNLFLSMLAAIQAPIILMAQNRQNHRDRRQAEHDYEVNLKAELEIMLLHEKLDALQRGPWVELMLMQQEQLRRLESLSLDKTTGRTDGERGANGSQTTPPPAR